jgi:ribosome-binding protein aMBF1 (putative translation factor)
MSDRTYALHAVRRPKKRALMAAGWRVGTPAEFLRLTEAESALVEIRLGLSSLLRKRRARLGWTQERIAKEIGSSQSRLAKMEGSDSTVSIDLLVRALLRLGVTRKELAAAIRSDAA